MGISLYKGLHHQLLINPPWYYFRSIFLKNSVYSFSSCKYLLYILIACATGLISKVIASSIRHKNEEVLAPRSYLKVSHL